MLYLYYTSVHYLFMYMNSYSLIIVYNCIHYLFIRSLSCYLFTPRLFTVSHETYTTWMECHISMRSLLQKNNNTLLVYIDIFYGHTLLTIAAPLWRTWSNLAMYGLIPIVYLYFVNILVIVSKSASKKVWWVYSML